MAQSSSSIAAACALAVATSLWSGPGHADSVVGAAAQCVKGESFTLIAADWGSDDPSENDPVPEGYERIDGKGEVSCIVGTSKVKGVIQVYPPADHGMGMGSGYASIDKLEVDGIPIFGHPTPFDWQIPGSDKALVRVKVSFKQEAPSVEVCDAEKCFEKSLAENVGLNYQYKRTMAGLSGREREQLRQEQRFWLKERDPQCQLAALDKRNEPLAFLQCIMAATQIRSIRLLDKQLKSKKPS